MIPKEATPTEAVATAVYHDVLRIVRHDPLVRLLAEVGDGDTAVHQMRVGCRRLRSDLRTFRRLLGPEWSDELRRELSWLADILGGVRDVEVLRARLYRTAASDPLSPLDEDHLALMDDALADREASAVETLDTALSSARYVALLDLLVGAVARSRPPCDPIPARKLRRLVRKPWRRLVRATALLTPDAPDKVWHAARIRAKRARYAVDVVAEVVGDPAKSLARSLSTLQDLLGEHQDAVFAIETWLSIAAADPARLGVTAGRLIERERGYARAARTAFPAAWREASSNKLTRWLS